MQVQAEWNNLVWVEGLGPFGVVRWFLLSPIISSKDQFTSTELPNEGKKRGDYQGKRTKQQHNRTSSPVNKCVSSLISFLLREGEVEATLLLCV